MVPAAEVRNFIAIQGKPGGHPVNAAPASSAALRFHHLQSADPSSEPSVAWPIGWIAAPHDNKASHLRDLAHELEASSGDELIDTSDEHNEFPPELGDVFSRMGGRARTGQPFPREPAERLRARQNRIALGGDPCVKLAQERVRETNQDRRAQHDGTDIKRGGVAP